MYNPFKIPNEFVFDTKTSDKVLKLQVNHLDNELIEFRQIIDGFEPDVLQNKNLPATFRTAKHEILSQTDILQKLFDFVKDEMYKFWEIHGELEIFEYGFFVYNEGAKFGKHSDNGGFDCGKAVIHQPNRKFSVLFYLDDYGVDYEGGELVFPHLIPKEIIKPKKYQVVIMPSNIYFMHEVREVTKGKRIIFTFFLDVKTTDVVEASR